MSSGDTLTTLRPSSYEGTASDSARIDRRNQRPILVFDAGVKRSTVFTALMPRNYSGGGLTVYIHYAMSSATVGTVDWDAAFERVGDGIQNLDSDGFAAIQSINDAVVPAVNGDVSIVSIPFTDGAQMDSIAVGESFRIKITKEAVSGSAAGGAEIEYMEIKET